MNLLRSVLFALTATLCALPSFATEIGDELPAFVLEDQAGVSHTLDESVQRIYANGDRKSGGMMEDAMTELDQSALDAQHAIVVAEISSAPGFVKRIIRSGLKDRSYTSWIDSKGSTKKFLPYRADRVTVIELDQRRVTAVRYITDAKTLKQEVLTVTPAEPSPTPIITE